MSGARNGARSAKRLSYRRLRDLCVIGNLRHLQLAALRLKGLILELACLGQARVSSLRKRRLIPRQRRTNHQFFLLAQ